MSNSFGAPNTQSGFTPGSTAQPAGGTFAGFTFGAVAAGAGDASKAAQPGLPQTTAQTQAKPYAQPFATSFASPMFGGPPSGGQLFGAAPSATTGFGTPASGTTGFAIAQQKPQAGNVPASTNAAIPGGLSFGTPITSSTTPTGTQIGFQTPASQPAGFGLGTLSAPSSTQGLSFGANQAAPTSSALPLNLGGTPAASGAPATGTISFGAPKQNLSGISSGTAPATSGGWANLSLGTPGIGGAQTPASGTGFNVSGASLQVVPSTGSAPVGSTPAASASGGFNLSGAQTQIALTTGNTFLNSNIGGTVTTTPASAPTSGFSLATPAASTTLALSSAPPTTAAPGFNLGGTTPAASTTGFTLGKSAAPPAASTAPQTSVPQTSLGTATNVTSSTGATSQAGGLNFCQLEECINKWTLELEEQEKAFVNQATQVNAWDRLLIANGEKIVTLNQEVERVKLEQQQLEHELDYVVGQQRELQDCLVPLEKELASVSASDPEREYTYRLAENLDTQLKQMSEDLKEIIEHLNEANRSQDSSDPIVQIGKILNAHMNSLQWLDQRTAVLQTRIQQIDQLHQNFRQEHERSFNLAYN